MNRAALFAAAGAGMLAIFYFFTNALPVLQSLDSVPVTALAQPLGMLVVPQLLWVWFFLCVSSRERARPAALVLLLAGVAPQTVYSWTLQWPTISFLSLDSILYIFTGVLQPVCYALFLLAVWRGHSARVAASILWALATFRAMALIADTAVLVPALSGPLTILAGPAILIFNWTAQSFFFRSWRRGAGGGGGSGT